jgi:hypothetical protein
MCFQKLKTIPLEIGKLIVRNRYSCVVGRGEKKNNAKFRVTGQKQLMKRSQFICVIFPYKVLLLFPVCNNYNEFSILFVVVS